MQDTRCKFWFGTEEVMQFIKTPMLGADSSPQGWSANGTLLNGGGWAFNSFGSHKQYAYEWGASTSYETAQLLKSYYDGTYGRGLIYFLDPNIYHTNVLPAHWADPSMAVNGEAPSLIAGTEPTEVSTPGATLDNRLPVKSAQYTFFNNRTSPSVDTSQFIPIPEGHTLYLGAFYTASVGTAGVFAQPVNLNGTYGPVQRLTPLSASSSSVVQDSFSGLKGVRLWVGATATGTMTITLSAMIGRLMATEQVPIYGPWVEQARNLFPNPDLAGSGTVEVRRNLWRTPAMSNVAMVTAQGSTLAVVADGLRITSTGSSPYRATTNASQRVPVSPSTSYWVTARRIIGSAIGTAASTSGKMSVVGYDSAGSHRSNAYSVSLGSAPTPGTEIIEQQITTPDWVVSLEVNFVSGSNVGDEVVWGQVAIGTVRGYFDGSTSPDQDLTASWTGTADASASILTGVAVTGVPSSPGSCLAIRSSLSVDGEPFPLRLISRTANSDSFVTVDVPTAAQGFGTLMGTRYQSEVIPSAGPWAMWINHPANWATLINEVGVQDYRLTYTASAIAGTRYHHAGAQGTNDVYWSKLGIFAGEYSGPVFSGNTPSPDPDLERYRWLGTANNSPSVYETRTLTGSPAALQEIMTAPWIGGQGNSGCRFIQPPSYVTNSPREGGKIGVAATFKEVGAWVYA